MRETNENKEQKGTKSDGEMEGREGRKSKPKNESRTKGGRIG